MDNMIRDIRPLQSADQNRLRDDNHRQGAKEDFARYLSTPEEEDAHVFSAQKKSRTHAAPSLIKNDMWSAFFVRLNSNNANTNSEELFHWGELRENAKRHTQVARQSALLQDNNPLHLLNEKI